jgi:hypothetical protein
MGKQGERKKIKGEWWLHLSRAPTTKIKGNGKESKGKSRGRKRNQRETWNK